MRNQRGMKVCHRSIDTNPKQKTGIVVTTLAISDELLLMVRVSQVSRDD